jgi:pimeloyl-ACP methyl ester carboxylesterase
MDLLSVETPQAVIAVEAHGPAAGPPAILLHGFPYAARCYDGVAPILAAAGLRVLVPHLRGYGQTRLKPGVLRSGAQGALLTHSRHPRAADPTVLALVAALVADVAAAAWEAAAAVADVLADVAKP